MTDKVDKIDDTGDQAGAQSVATVNRVGRPTVYHDRLPEEVFRLALLGLNNQDICRHYHITEDTFYQWVKNYPKFSEAIDGGREKADSVVAGALYQKAIQGDVPAAVKWLSCRQKSRWNENYMNLTASQVNVQVNLSLVLDKLGSANE